jgi:hypothetical protein
MSEFANQSQALAVAIHRAAEKYGYNSLQRKSATAEWKWLMWPNGVSPLDPANFKHGEKKAKAKAKVTPAKKPIAVKADPVKKPAPRMVTPKPPTVHKNAMYRVNADGLKRCSTCERVKSATKGDKASEFTLCQVNVDGFAGACKTCKNQGTKDRNGGAYQQKKKAKI